MSKIWTSVKKVYDEMNYAQEVLYNRTFHIGDNKSNQQSKK